MIKPTIHLNGSSPESLLAGYVDAGQAIETAIRALEECAPNARDYGSPYEDAFRTARDEHHKRINCLRGVLAEMHALAEHVQDAIDARVSTCGRCGEEYPDPNGGRDCPRCYK